MKKKVFLRGLLGFPIGISLGYIITILISLVNANGYYSAYVPQLVDVMGSEINAVVLQAFLSGVIGFSFGASSVIWEMDEWSIAKQTGIYFAITASVVMPVAYLARWMEPTFWGFVKYFGIFVVIFIVIWLMQYAFWKNKIDKVNQEIENKRKTL
ncbi:MAG: DUF3021 domain-containing protein [Erysipelotrichia bacterium]|nr:DUF3021 domain-containing protein [Erysipelotrichia bacterium]